MPSFFRLMEVFYCSLADFIPYLLLVVYPFRNHLRLKNFLAGFLATLMGPALLYYTLTSALGTSTVGLPFPLMRSALLLVFSLLVIRANIGKVLLNTLSVINISLLISALTDQFCTDYTVKHFLVTILLQVLLLGPYTVNLAYCLAPTLNESKAPVWNFLFVAPAVGTVLGLLFMGSKALSVVMILALILAAAAAALILHKTETEMINLLLKKDRPVKAAKATQTVQAVQPTAETKPQQNLEQAYLKALQKRMNDAEHSYKELLLQVMTMEDDLNQDNLEQLRARLSTMRNQLAPEVNPTGNTSIDPIMTYYTRQALLSNVKIATNLSLPDVSSVTDEEMTVLMGCLMDCALDACREMTTGTRRIATASYLDDGLLQIGVKHTYASAVDSNCEQLKICRKIVSRYDGKLTVLDMGGVAQIVAVLHI